MDGSKSWIEYGQGHAGCELYLQRPLCPIATTYSGVQQAVAAEQLAVLDFRRPLGSLR
jgi:hypothetical protein